MTALIALELCVTWYVFYLAPSPPCVIDSLLATTHGACTQQLDLPLYYLSFTALSITVAIYIARDRRRYATTMSILSVPLSILVADEAISVLSRFMQQATTHLPPILVHWMDNALDKPDFRYLAASFVGILLLTPALFQLLHHKASWRPIAMGGCTLSCLAYGIMLFFPQVLLTPLVFRTLN